MSGDFYLGYKDMDNEYSIMLLEKLKNTITCIRTISLNDNNFDLKKFVFLCTTNGYIYIYEVKNNKAVLLFDFVAHSPQPENNDMRFGSLKFKSEVWSISVIKKYEIENNDMILNLISGSEDQTIKIWEIKIFDLLNFSDKNENNFIRKMACYKNHDLAVTSVDYKILNFITEKKRIIASCSDDKYINIYDANNNEINLIKKLTTQNNVFGWHTITYLSLEEVI